ncbi:histidine kinase [Agromyces sp. H3Y2-19a]|uniref:sensor histidine kinase n=1 Tax=Agromyces TaxID=33877 RepID=UPI001E3385F2|nr:MULTISPECIES: histidine kinase [Agromyces]MCD5345898.1 histidine kinase [Agromyces sp. S2-1-8]MDF0512266.1 histidine kinase [Agromyces chromiiresistens]
MNLSLSTTRSGGAPAPTDADRRLRAWAWLATSALALVLFAVSVPLAATIYGVHLLGAFATCLALAGALPLAMRFPRTAAVVATWGILMFALLSAGSEGAPWPWPVTTIIGQTALLLVLGMNGMSWFGMFVVWLAGVVVTVPFAFVDAGATANEIAAASLTAVALPIALLIAQRRVIAGELFRERAVSAAEQERRVLVEERNRIARELHDVVAHGLSIIHVQATSAPYRVDGLSDAARAEFAEIAESARVAMTEMRQLLGVLRSSDSTAETAPQPGLDDLPALVASVERGGVPVTLELGDRLPEGGLAATAAFRIVQEALSNVVRHAPGASTHVSIEVLADELVVGVENEAPPAASPTAGPGSDAGSEADSAGAGAHGGHGLVGIDERAALLGGRAEHGPRPGGGYRVLATLPLGSDGGPW